MNNRFLWAGIIGGLAAAAVYFLTKNLTIMLSAGAAAFAVFSVLMKPAKDQDPMSVILNETKTADSILSEGELNLKTAVSAASKIDDETIQKKAYEICSSMLKILQELRMRPNKIPSVRKFLNYYLPTLTEILNKFERIEENNAADAETQRKVTEYLTAIENATKKLHANMFEDELLDMSVDMEIMTQSVKEEGLLEDENQIQLPSNG